MPTWRILAANVKGVWNSLNRFGSGIQISAIDQSKRNNRHQLPPKRTINCHSHPTSPESCLIFLLSGCDASRFVVGSSPREYAFGCAKFPLAEAQQSQQSEQKELASRHTYRPTDKPASFCVPTTKRHIIAQQNFFLDRGQHRTTLQTSIVVSIFHIAQIQSFDKTFCS